MTARNPYGGLPFKDDDASIARALEDVSIPTLMLSMVHMSGDPSIIRGKLRPQGLFLNEIQGFMSPEDQAEVRRLALEVIRKYRDGGCRLPPPPSPQLIHEMMNFVACEEVAAEYVPMMLEEMALDGKDPGLIHWGEQIDEATRRAFPVVVIGAGSAGLLAGMRLKEAGIPFTILEKNPGVGGTWWENSYPGARVDVGNHFYCYSFEPSDHWSEFFARQSELQAYFQEVTEKHGIGAHIRFETEALACRYDEKKGLWHVTVRNPDGREEQLPARALISAVGQLNRPKLPDIPGREDFQGPSFHSSQWDHEVSYKGKRVAIIGTGASAFQIVPAIAPEVASLKVFQRSPPWILPNPNYHAKVGDGVRWALRHLPFYGRWYRFLLFWPGCDGGMKAMRVDPEWPNQDQSVSAENDFARQVFLDSMKSQVGDDEELLAKITPDYPAMGKRLLQDNGSWLQALTRENVELVDESIDRIAKDRILCRDGSAHEVDIILYATGFHANRFLWPMRVEGRGGVELAKQWGDEPAAYLGITVPHFPNLFCMYGPGTNLAHGGSLIFHSECQIRYIMGCIQKLLQEGRKDMEPRQDVHDEYYARTQKELEGSVWAHPKVVHSWYKNDKGKIHVLSPWRLVDYWSWTREPNPGDFVFR